MNKEEMIAHFKQREEDMSMSVELMRQIRGTDSAIAQLLCALSYDIALMTQYQLEKEDNE